MIRSIADIDLSGRKVFMRLDLNVPLKNGAITSDARIRAALPTIQYALDKDVAVVLCSHLGRPMGKRVPDMSLEPVRGRLSEFLARDVSLADDCTGDSVRSLVRDLRPGKVLLLENLRYHDGEKRNDANFVRELAAAFDPKEDVYINDAFGACHREHASIVGVPALFERRAAGFLLAKEIEALSRLLHDPPKPFVALVGGAKVADKLGVLGSLLPRLETLCIGGAMAFTFLKAEGIGIGNSPCEEEKLAAAKDLRTRARDRGVKLLLPVDHVAAQTFEEHASPLITSDATVPAGYMGLDIGPKTRDLIELEVRGAATVFWNGPMGVCEWDSFAAGTNTVAAAMAANAGYTVVGGGDSVAAIEKSGCNDKIDHVSTGGGASLELLQFGTLPGVEILNLVQSPRRAQELP